MFTCTSLFLPGMKHKRWEHADLNPSMPNPFDSAQYTIWKVAFGRHLASDRSAVAFRSLRAAPPLGESFA